MRTTLHVDNDVYQAARSLAKAEGKGIGKILSALARRGLQPVRKPKNDEGFPVFEVAGPCKPITAEMVKQCLEES